MERAREKAARELTPAELQERMTDIAYWRKRVAYWEHKQRTIDPGEPWYPRVIERRECCQEILDVMLQDARALNRQLR